MKKPLAMMIVLCWSLAPLAYAQTSSGSPSSAPENASPQSPAPESGAPQSSPSNAAGTGVTGNDGSKAGSSGADSQSDRHSSGGTHRGPTSERDDRSKDGKARMRHGDDKASMRHERGNDQEGAMPQEPGAATPAQGGAAPAAK